MYRRAIITVFQRKLIFVKDIVFSKMEAQIAKRKYDGDNAYAQK